MEILPKLANSKYSAVFAHLFPAARMRVAFASGSSCSMLRAWNLQGVLVSACNSIKSVTIDILGTVSANDMQQSPFIIRVETLVQMPHERRTMNKGKTPKRMNVDEVMIYNLTQVVFRREVRREQPMGISQGKSWRNMNTRTTNTRIT